MADEQNNKIIIRNELQLECFKLRFKGHTYVQIAELIKERPRHYSESTLELYFAPGGLWHEPYVAWKTWQLDQLKDHMNSMFMAQAIDSTQQIINIAHGKLMIKVVNAAGKEELVPLSLKGDTILKANQDILDRAGFKPIQKVETTPSEDIAEKMMREMELRKAQKITQERK